jgi:hypothetical protein
MDKNIIINYYVDWKSTDWLKDLFETNGFEWSDEFEEKEIPGRAPIINEQNGI